MKITDIKLFGTLSGIFIGTVLALLYFALRINVLNIESIGQLPLLVGLIPISIFLGFAIFAKQFDKSVLNKIYLLVAAFSFVYLFSRFQWNVECCPNDYESMYDWNAAKGISWMIYLPLTYIIVLGQGLFYDIVRELKIRSSVSIKNLSKSKKET